MHADGFDAHVGLAGVSTVRLFNPNHKWECKMTNEKIETMDSQALLAIHEEVLKLLATKLPSEIESKIALIESICRYRHDVKMDGK